jgi:hypothetical protein
MCFLLLLVLGSYATCRAQASPLPTHLDAAALPSDSAAHVIPDSVRQAVQQLFRRGRRYSLAAGVSGLFVLSSGVIYTAREGVNWGTTPNILYGGGVAATGLLGRAHYSRRRERQALAALEHGYRLPAYAAEFAPLLPKRNREIVYRYL